MIPGRPVGRRGFALPFTIFLVTLITLMLAFAFSRSAVEVQISDSTEASLEALAVAQGGLFAFLGDTFAVRPTPGDSIRYNVAGGYAWVVPEEFQMPADTINNPIVYAIRSAGYVIHPNQGSTPQAQRTVVQFARWQSPPVIPSVPALITSANGVVNPGGGQLRVMAANQCLPPDPGWSAPDIRTLYTRPVIPFLDASSGNIYITDPLATTIAASSGVDWSQVANGTFNADYNSIQVNDTTYSSQLVNGNATITMPDSGTGLLIVTGNLYITGALPLSDDVDWYGVILVGGYVVSRANFFDLHGVLVTGLNAPFAPPIPADTLGGGDADFLYNPCEINRALRRLRGFAALPRTWVDNWAMY